MAQVNLGSVYGSLELDTTKWTAGIDKAQTSLAGLGTSVSNSMKKTETAVGQSMTNVGKSMSNVGRGLTVGLTAPIVAFGTLSVKAFSDFDEQLRNIQSITKDTDADIQVLGDNFLAMSKKFPQGAATIAEGFYQIASSGFYGADATKILESALLGATAGLTDTETAVVGITGVLNAYGLSAEEATRINDILFETVNRGVVTFPELSGAIGQVISTSSQAGVSFEEVGAAIATMTKRGISADEATTALNQAMLTMIKPTTELQSAINGLGYETGLQMIQELGFGEALKQVSGSADGNIEKMAGMFTNVRALKGVLSLTGDETVMYAEDLKAMQGASEGAGAAQLAFNEQSKSLAFQLGLAKNEVNVFQTELGKAIEPQLTEFLKELGSLLTKVTEWVKGLTPEQKKLIIQFVAFLAVLGPIIAILGTVITFIGGVVTAVGAISAAFATGGVIATAFTAVIGALGAVFAFLISPIGLVILAIVALIAIGVLLYKNWDKIVAFFSGIWQNTIVPAWNSAIATLKGIVENIGKAITGALLDIWIGVLSAWQSAHDALVGVVDTIANAVVNGFNAVVNFFTTTLPNAIMNFVTVTLPNFAIAFVKGVIDMFLSVVGAFITGIGFILGLIIIGIPMLITTIVNFFLGLPAKIAGIWTDVTTAIGNWITDTVSYLSVAIPELIKSIGDWFSALPEIIWNWLVNTWNLWVTWRDGVYKTVGDAILNLLKSVGDWLSKLPTIIWDWLTKTLNNFKTWGTQTYNYLSTQVASIIANIVGWFTSLPSKIVNALSKLGETIKTTFTNAYTSVISEVSTWPSKFAEWGLSVAKSFADGFAKIGDWIKDKLKAGLDSAKKWLKGQSPPVAGPLRDIDKWGFNVGNAWVQGFGNAFDSIDKAMSGGLGGFGGVNARPAVGQTSDFGVGGSGGNTYNVYIGMYAGSAMEKREIAKQLSNALTDYQKGVGIYE